MKRMPGFWCLLISMQAVYAEPAVVLCDASRGLVLMEQANPPVSQVEMILQGCDQVSPDRADVLVLHALLAAKNHDDAAALKWLEKAHASAPDNQNITLTLADMQTRAENWGAVNALYQSLLQKNPNNRHALLGLAAAYRAQKQFPDARAIYERKPQ